MMLRQPRDQLVFEMYSKLISDSILPRDAVT